MEKVIILDGGDKVFAAGGKVFGPPNAVAPPTLSLSIADSATVVEDAASEASFVVSLSAPNHAAATTFSYTTANGTAQAGTDYTATSGTGSISAGNISTTITVPILDPDSAYAPPRNFFLTISAASGGSGVDVTITRATGACTIVDDDAPAGDSPMEDGLHPRFGIVPDGYAGYGVTVSAMRTRLATSYPSAFQTYITHVEGFYSTSPAAMTHNQRCWYSVGFAFLALMDPAEMGTFTWARTQAQYATKAKEIAYYMAENSIQNGEGASDPESQGAGNGPGPWAAAVTWSWTMGADSSVWSEGEKTQYLYWLIRGWKLARSAGYTGPYLNSYNCGKWMFRLVGWAFSGDTVSGTYTPTGNSLMVEVENARADGQTFLAGFQNEDAYEMAGGANWPEGPYYWHQALLRWALCWDAVGAAEGTNYFYQLNCFRYWPKFDAAAVRATHPDTTGRYSSIKMDNSVNVSWNHNSSDRRVRLPYQVCGPLVGADDDMAGLAKWCITNFGETSLTSDGASIRTSWLFWRFIWGHEHLDSSYAQSPSDLSFPRAILHGTGLISIRTDYEDEGATKICLMTPEQQMTGGHGHNDAGHFLVEKYGPLFYEGGTGKNAGSAYPQKSIRDLELNIPGIYRAGSTTSLGGVTFNDMGTAYRSTSLSPNVTYCSSHACGIGSRSLALNQTDVDYVRYNWTNCWSSLKCSFAVREWVYLAPRSAGGTEFLLVYDRLTAVDASYYKWWHLRTGWKPEPVGDTYTTVESTPAVGVVEGGRWTATGDTFKVANAGGGVPRHGVAFIKALYPTSRSVIVTGGDTYEFRDPDLVNVNPGTPSYVPSGGVSWLGKFLFAIRPGSDAASDTFLNVLHLGDADVLSAINGMERLEGVGWMGVHLQEAEGSRVVIFPNNYTGAALEVPIEYTLTGRTSGVTHVFAHLTPGGSYTLAAAGDTFTLTSGGALTADAIGFLRTTT